MNREQLAVAKGELIGLTCTVASSTDARKAGVRGVVVDETMRTLTIDTGERVVMVAKPECSLRFESRGTVEVRGADIAFRPEDRIKKVR